MFVLDEKLEKDTWCLGEFSLCSLLLLNDANYPWFVLVPRRSQVVEFFEMNLEDQHLLMGEVRFVAAMMKKLFVADKINTAMLGNVVSQLHIHVIARYKEDIAWPTPVWGAKPALPYSSSQVSDIKIKLFDTLDNHSSFKFKK